jgi:hypothetical protein
VSAEALLPPLDATEARTYEAICRSDGITAREIAKEIGAEKTEGNRLLYVSPFIRELCYRDADFRWYGLIQQTRPHHGLYDFCGYYDTVERFRALSEEAWLSELQEGCRRIGRNLNDTRGLIHSFRDCRETMRRLFEDLREMSSLDTSSWEIVFELRLNLRRMIRIYADVLVITPERVFPLEFKMKNAVDPDEVLQAAKYVPFLENLFGPGTDIYPALVLTGASELFTEAQIGKTDCVLPVCSGDMLFNVFNEAIGFLG